jgi:hypothetical protein
LHSYRPKISTDKYEAPPPPFHDNWRPIQHEDDHPPSKHHVRYSDVGPAEDDDIVTSELREGLGKGFDRPLSATVPSATVSNNAPKKPAQSPSAKSKSGRGRAASIIAGTYNKEDEQSRSSTPDQSLGAREQKHTSGKGTSNLKTGAAAAADNIADSKEETLSQRRGKNQRLVIHAPEADSDHDHVETNQRQPQVHYNDVDAEYYQDSSESKSGGRNSEPYAQTVPARSKPRTSHDDVDWAMQILRQQEELERTLGRKYFKTAST